MIFEVSNYIKYLEMTGEGYKVKPDCPADKLEELKQMNEEYENNYGEALFLFDD